MRRLLLAIVLGLAAGAAQADNAFFYLGAGLSRPKVSNVTNGGLSYTALNNTSWKVLAGFRPISLLAVEADYMDLGSQTNTFIGGGGSHADAKAFTAYALGFLPLPVPFLDIYGKAGLARWKLNGNASAGPAVPLFSFSNQGTDFAWGAGVQAHAGNIGGRLEYESFNIPNTNGARVFSLSVVFNMM